MESTGSGFGAYMLGVLEGGGTMMTTPSVVCGGGVPDAALQWWQSQHVGNPFLADPTPGFGTAILPLAHTHYHFTPRLGDEDVERIAKRVVELLKAPAG